MEKMVDVELPNGKTAQFPASMSHDEISGVLRKQFPMPKKPSLGSELMRGPKNFASGLAKSGHKLLNVPSAIARGMGDTESADILSFRPGYDYDQAVGAPKEKDFTDILTQMAPEIAGAFAVPELEGSALISQIPKAGPYINKILAQGLPQAGYGALMSEPGQGTEAGLTAGLTQAPFSAASQLALSPVPFLQKVGSIGLGTLGAGATTYGLSEMGLNPYMSGVAGTALGVLGGKAAGTKQMMMDELTHGIDLNKAAPRLEAAKRLGLTHLTPAEAAKSPHLAEKQGEYGRTQEGADLSYLKNQQRNSSEVKAIEKTLDEIYHPESMEAQITQGYEDLKGSMLPEDFAKRFADNDIVAGAQETLRTDKIYKQGAKKNKLPTHDEIVIDKQTGEPVIDPKTGLPKTEKVLSKDNVAYWNEVKKIIDDDVSKMEGKNPTKEFYLDQARRELIESLDDIHPDYAEVRNLSEREHVRRDLEKAFDRTQVHSGAAFYQALASEKKFNEMMHHLRNVPKAQESLKDMRELFQDFSRPPTVKAGLGASRMGMRQHRNAIDKAKHMFENMFTKGKFDKEAIEFMTSADWDKQMGELNNIRDPQKRFSKMIEIFGKGVAQSNAKNAQNEQGN